jgi:hypothetical protein
MAERMLPRDPVKSSAIASIGYDKINRHLEIELSNGRIYRYSKVPQRTYTSLLKAKSIGAYYARFIRGNELYPALEITPDRDVPIYDQLKRSLDQ